MPYHNSKRREFLKQSILSSSSLLLLPSLPAEANESSMALVNKEQPFFASDMYALDLSPAKWIWFPSQRTLPNSFIFFRKEVNIPSKPVKATGWILGDSRYRLHINDHRIQWGPAPADPRWAEADPLDLADKLQTGKNIIGAEVLYYGFGDGTWPIGKPGFIFKLDLEFEGGITQSVISDESWLTQIAYSWKPGQYKRWYLRSLQEEFDARLYPYNWLQPGHNTAGWHHAMLIPGSNAAKPVIASYASDYLNDSGGDIPEAQLRKRSIAMMKEEFVPVKKLSEQMWLRWKIPVDDYFRFVTPEKNSFEVVRENFVEEKDNTWSIQMKDGLAALITFEFAEQHVGFPCFTIEAAEGTVVELLVHEAHRINSEHTIMNTHFNSWSKFTCKEGINHFEEFDYESLRWLQLHIRNTNGVVKISKAGMRRRIYQYKNIPAFRCNDDKLQKLFNACVNTVYNQSQETIVDGMARERQQYSGDLGHIVHALANGFGSYEMISRFCNTYSQGLTKAGFFLDTWPAYDRLARLMEREIGMTNWGPLIDHGVGFNFDCYHYYMYTGDTKQLAEVYPRLKRFFGYLQTIRQKDGTMPVENIGIPAVWIDHTAYKKQKHKECAFSLYVAAMCMHVLPALAKAFHEDTFAVSVIAFGKSVHQSTVKKYWSPAKNLFICNKPWAAEEGEDRYCDRSLATAILYNLSPSGEYKAMTGMLADKPTSLGISYPANAVWRLWALAKQKRTDVLLSEFRAEWYNAPSVQLNNTLAEFFDIRPDTTGQWSHASVAPMFCMYMYIAGIKPLAPGFAVAEIAPQLHDLRQFYIENHTIHGPVILNLTKEDLKLKGSISIPEKMQAVLKWNNKTIPLKPGKQDVDIG